MNVKIRPMKAGGMKIKKKNNQKKFEHFVDQKKPLEKLCTKIPLIILRAFLLGLVKKSLYLPGTLSLPPWYAFLAL